jgi:Tol biopolymer transport system component
MTGKTMNYRVSPIIKTDSIQGQEMDWSPDGKWLAYISQYGHYGIELLDTESGKIYCGLDNNKISIKMLDWR